jgi:hypothetical protein
MAQSPRVADAIPLQRHSASAVAARDGDCLVRNPTLMEGSPIEGGDWPLFGWDDDIRRALAEARSAARAVVLATLYAR